MKGSIATENLVRDLGQALRWVPAFSLAVISSLVVCTGPSALIFSALYALGLKPRPDTSPLVNVKNVAEKSGEQIVRSSSPQFRGFQAHVRSFTGFTAIAPNIQSLDDEQRAIRLPAAAATRDFFGVLGTNPIAGRFFTAEDEVTGRGRAVVLSASYRAARDQADPAVIGSTIRLNDQPCTIIGVATGAESRSSDRAPCGMSPT